MPGWWWPTVVTLRVRRLVCHLPVGVVPAPVRARAVRGPVAASGRNGSAWLVVFSVEGTASVRMCRLGLGMSPWSWVLTGLAAAWLAPAVAAGLVLGWALLRHPEKRARRRKPPREGQPPSDS